MESPHTLLQRGRPRPDPARRRIAPRLRAPTERELVLDRYRLLERLGAGGFGVVWRAHDELLSREVAVKRLWLGPDGDIERAEREALASARLSHPAIVALFEACAVEEAFYLISELVRGDTLGRLIAQENLEDLEVAEIGLALSGALTHAHARGVIHRDIKPQNVLVPERSGGSAGNEEAPAAKLTDFGGASLIGEEALTRTGDVLGTLAYMAPEQSEGRTVGVQADLYSLALVLYESLCGVNPVRGATPAATVRRIGQRLPPLARARPDLHPELARALDRGLSPDPRERGELEHLAEALHEAIEDPHAAVSAPPQRRPGAWRAPSAPTWDPEPDPERFAVDASPYALPRPRAPRLPDPDPDPAPLAESEAPPDRRSPSLPRSVWITAACVLVGWQAIGGRPGLALLLAAALAPLLVLPRGGRSGLGVGWLSCALAPALGFVGLAGAYPAIAGQPSRWRERAALGALGYWWLVLSEPLLDPDTHGRLWLGQPSGTPPRSVWEGSLSATASHVLSPLLVLGVLCGALLWGVGAVVLPWLVRGRSVAVDFVAVTVWSALLAAAAPTLDSGPGAHAGHPSPHGLVLGAAIGAAIALAARALRGPV